MLKVSMLAGVANSGGVMFSQTPTPSPGHGLTATTPPVPEEAVAVDEVAPPLDTDVPDPPSPVVPVPWLAAWHPTAKTERAVSAFETDFDMKDLRTGVSGRLGDNP
jgi:hypothetical protein